MSRNRRSSSEARPLFDPKYPHSVVPYHNYTVPELAEILSQGPDRVRTIFRDDRYGKVHRIPSGRARSANRRNYLNPRPYITLLIPYSVLMRFFDDPRLGA